MRVHPMWEAYPELKADLSAVLELIDSHIRVHDSAIERRIKDMIRSSGKMLRPAYSLLCSKIGPERNRSRALAVAAALECLHMATLVHDDVIDQSDTRHGRPAVHTLYGNKIAVYTGDYLFSLSFSLLARHASSLPHLRVDGIPADRILAGELEQLHAEFKPPSSIKNYLSQISGKTAQLFAISCYSGAMESRSSSFYANRAYNMGHDIGMAFQIIDDILDYQGNRDRMGKPVMSDLRRGIYTLPVIYTFKTEPKTMRPLLEKRAHLTDQEIDTILDCIHRCRGIERARELAKKYTRKALQELDQLPEGKNKATLRKLTLALLERNR